jgi:translocation and assembly module TamB
MADVDKLAYIVLGHPLGSAGASSQTALLAQAAGALLSSSQATDLRGEIKGRLGLSTLGFETGSGATTGSIGYRTIPVAPPGKTPTASTASDSLLTVGKYLTPQLYLSYGRSLFTGGNLFRLRYDIFKHWQVETQTGAESGGDIFYSIEFE